MSRVCKKKNIHTYTHMHMWTHVGMPHVHVPSLYYLLPWCQWTCQSTHRQTPPPPTSYKQRSVCWTEPLPSIQRKSRLQREGNVSTPLGFLGDNCFFNFAHSNRII